MLYNDSSAPPPAKLGRPRLHQVLPRDRLFAELDARKHRPAVWVCGPPGAGKTTLLATYLDSRAAGGVWFRCDAGDRDLSTWFYYLGEGIARHAPGTRPLPMLTPEYLPDLATFGRRWFRQCFAALGAGLLILDNYQEASSETLDELLSASLQDLPDGLSIVFISRATPGARFSRALVHGDMSVLGWESLRLTPEEARAVAASKGVTSPERVEALQSTCDGWAAGLTLLLEQAEPAEQHPDRIPAASRETLFNYFAGQVFDALPAVAQRDLMLCSYLPRVSGAQAAALTGNARAVERLEQFHRRQLFTSRQSADDPVYEFHALFRAFLRDRSRGQLAEDERARALRDAAGILLTLAQPTEALSLYAEAEDWGAVEAVIVRHASRLLAQGRGQTLRDWLAVLPEDQLARDPWMMYWQGAALLSHDQQRARALLTRVYERFVESDDFQGQVMAASGILDTYFFSYSGYAELAQWADRVAGLLAQTARFTSQEQRLQACSTYLLACFFGDGAHPDLPLYVDEMRRLIHAPMEPPLRLRAGTFLASYAGAVLHPSLVEADLGFLDGLADDPAMAPLRVAQWHQRFAYLCYQRGEYDLALARLRKALALCEEHGLRSPRSLINQILVFVLVASGDAQGAGRVLDDWERLLTPDRPVERTQWNAARLVVWCALERSRERWVPMAHEVAAQMDVTGQTWIRLVNRLPGAYALIECGAYDSVATWIVELRAIMAGTCFVRFERDVLLLEAALAMHRGQTGAMAAPLSEALRLTLVAQVPLQLAHSPRLLAALLKAAVRHDTLRETALAVAARYGLSLAAPLLGEPPPLFVRTLGGFALQRRLDAVPASNQRRPLDLLKFLVAQGGRGVPVSAVLEALWPEADGDRAGSALKVAIHRLRHQLQVERAILVSGGSITLDPALCGSDVQGFEQQAERAERLRVAGDLSGFEAATNAALALYRGPFLPEAEETPWVLSARERLGRRALQLTLALAAHFESAGRGDEAVAIYESALVLDGLAESIYQRLMQLHIGAGRHAEALLVFRRCTEMLSVVHGTTPAARTQALFRQARAGVTGTAAP